MRGLLLLPLARASPWLLRASAVAAMLVEVGSAPDELLAGGVRGGAGRPCSQRLKQLPHGGHRLQSRLLRLRGK